MLRMSVPPLEVLGVELATATTGITSIKAIIRSKIILVIRVLQQWLNDWIRNMLLRDLIRTRSESRSLPPFAFGLNG
ncbi:hypothetical protein SBF1_6030002 [Candidatus Desulfosporosinus infrequens]|uniref:Uncharacterized protein n=1 Tax=Candidatus Desulfosporosinus infrequens TaxID=2043169 RepID=A0A2U3LL62_9FIRM|nr:hypothetical protein SBF1_6030002 [Candidatus Desulfosporosinus infrequens]